MFLRARALLVWFVVGCGPSTGGLAGESGSTESESGGTTSVGGADADPAEVLELLQTIVERSLACADCALCAELDNAACASLMGC